MKIIDKIVSRVGRRIDESSPMVDARLPDGSRVNAIIPPLALDGPILSIRRFSAVPLQMDNLIELPLAVGGNGAVPRAPCPKAKINILISGGTGTGKTTLLNILSGYIPDDERIVTIEDAAELQLQQPHVVRLETRPPNIEGSGEVTQRALVRNALRMRPDRIILGEMRGAEALDMLQAMNTGHEGSMTTVHANTARDALARLENMIAMAGVDLPAKAARAQIASAIGVIVQANRLSDGTRKLTSIQEITGMEGETITMQEIFVVQADRRRRHRRGRGLTSPPPACVRASGSAWRPAASICPSRCSTPATQRPERRTAPWTLSFVLFAVVAFLAVVLALEGVYNLWASQAAPRRSASPTACRH